MKFVLLILLSISCYSYCQKAPIVYSLRLHELGSDRKAIHFVSVSDRYLIKENEDALAIPAKYLGQRTTPAEEHIILNGTYRQRCLTATNISEDDVVYIYDYLKDKLLRFYVRGLNLVAVRNQYTSDRDRHISHHDYHIGFQISSDYLGDYKDYHSHKLVSIGRSNPFTRGQIKPIAWSKVDSTQFPAGDKLILKNVWLVNGKSGETYQYQSNAMTYFIQNIMINDGVAGRHLVVINTNTKAILFEQIYVDSEGGDPSLLNFVHPEYGDYLNQFTGQLFKNLPPVVFGFMDHSFGCPSIDFITKNKERVYIHCDNRH